MLSVGVSRHQSSPDGFLLPSLAAGESLPCSNRKHDDDDDASYDPQVRKRLLRFAGEICTSGSLLIKLQLDMPKTRATAPPMTAIKGYVLGSLNQAFWNDLVFFSVKNVVEGGTDDWRRCCPIKLPEVDINNSNSENNNLAYSMIGASRKPALPFKLNATTCTYRALFLKALFIIFSSSKVVKQGAFQ